MITSGLYRPARYAPRARASPPGFPTFPARDIRRPADRGIAQRRESAADAGGRGGLPPSSAAMRTSSPILAASGWCAMGICLNARNRDRHRSGRGALSPRTRPRWRRLRAHPLFVGDVAALRAPIEAPGGVDSDSLSQGHSTGEFDEALAALLGMDAAGLSASTIGRLKDAWSDEHLRWSKRDLSAKHYVYTSGPTASTCRPAWRTMFSACWSSSVPRRRVRRSSSASSTGWAKAPNPGGGCSWI
jgi:hypothetical protein